MTARTAPTRKQPAQRQQRNAVSSQVATEYQHGSGHHLSAPAQTSSHPDTRIFPADVNGSNAIDLSFPSRTPSRGQANSSTNFNANGFVNYSFMGDGQVTMNTVPIPIPTQQDVYMNGVQGVSGGTNILNTQLHGRQPHGTTVTGPNNGQNTHPPRLYTSNSMPSTQPQHSPPQIIPSAASTQHDSLFSPLPASANTDNTPTGSMQMMGLPGIVDDAANEVDPSPVVEATIPGSPSKNPYLMPDPPELDAWRQKLFHVDSKPLILSEEEYLMYFPHVDNVYSHRSTQKYKRKPFVSHYWDCRLKGRPSGTPKSDDPNKKKRKRQARERDLCDVKIKVTEHFSVADIRRLNLNVSGNGMNGTEMGEDGGLTVIMEDGMEPTNAFGVLEPARRFPTNHPGAEGKRWFSIQRVNGTAAGGEDGANDGVGASEDTFGHKHTLAESDRIKKNSIQRLMLKEDKEKKKLGKVNDGSELFGGRNSLSSSLYLASGPARQTVLAHKTQSPQRLRFYGNSFCPFSQRVWIALEIKKVQYQYFEILPSQARGMRPMPADMLEGNPGGVSPCIRHGNWTLWESGVLLEYLEDLDTSHSLLPKGSPHLRAHCRLWTDHINRKILPAFYSLLLTPLPGSQADMLNQQTSSSTSTNTTGMSTLDQLFQADKHAMLVTTLQDSITSLVNASHATGPYFMGSEIGYVDVSFAPWIIRISRVLAHFGKFPRPEIGTRWQQWADAIESDERVRRTISDEASYQTIYAVAAGENSIKDQSRAMVELSLGVDYARQLLSQEGFGLGGDIWGRV